jgi:hypothetical protein
MDVADAELTHPGERMISIARNSLMPAHKLKPQKLHCPFCSSISTRGTGLSSHIRAQHPTEYGKWNKNPNRLPEAAAAVSPQQEPKRNRRLHTVQSSAKIGRRKVAAAAEPIQEQPTELAATASYTGENEALTLLQTAYEQLSARKQTIEAELARIEGLRGEHEAVTAQVAALDQAMNAFHHQPRSDSKTA